MAAARGKAAPVGSAGWIQSERGQSARFVEQEVEEFGFSVRNELEWLNEHMGDIFSTRQTNFADIFKTPGKLRGKTPRTARKQNTLGTRAPLTDIFAPNHSAAAPSSQKTVFHEKVARFQIAEDAENLPPQDQPGNPAKSPLRAPKTNTDSGYHGMTEDEMDVDTQPNTQSLPSPRQPQKIPLREDQPALQRLRDAMSEERRMTEESFVSAKEGFAGNNVSNENIKDNQDDDNDTVPDEDIEMELAGPPLQHEVLESPAPAPELHDEVHVVEDEPEQMDADLDDSGPHSHSDVSSPEKPLMRKSSLTFASLPARDPLTVKRSIGRGSQVDLHTNTTIGRSSVLARSFGGKSFGISQQTDAGDEAGPSQEKSEEMKAHGKTSTQLLHERINMLGKTNQARPSKSIPASVLNSQSGYPQLPAAEPEKVEEGPQMPAKDEEMTAVPTEDEDDDWIAPTKAKAAQSDELPLGLELTKADPSPTRPAMHQKSISTTFIPSPSKAAMAPESLHKLAVSVSNPNLTQASGEVGTSTPAASPTRQKYHDGPLSASKSKLYSVLKSAKNIFASSASASAAAKLEVHSPALSRIQSREISGESKMQDVATMPGALYPDLQRHGPAPGRPVSVVSASPSKTSTETRKTRSSTENEKKREKEARAQQKAGGDLERAREKERAKVAKQQAEREKTEQTEAAKLEQQRHNEARRAEEMPPPPPPKGMLPAGKLRMPGRLIKPATREVNKAKPAPVNIRVASQSQRLGQIPSAQSLFPSLQEGPPPPPKQQQRPGSMMRSASATGSRPSTAPNNARVKALEAAARKKELEEKAAQRKAEQKRELEQKRAAKVEEERRLEQERRAAEQLRAQEAKMAAQKQAAEQKRREQQRQQEAMQREAVQKAKAAHELAEAIQRERAQVAPQYPRGDVGGTLRQLAKHTVPEPRLLNQGQQNQAKAVKRVFDPDEDEQVVRPPLHRGPPSYQQNNAKRRKTDELDDAPDERHSVMAPPKRPSNMRKESTLAKFPHGYTHAPPPAAHHASMFKATVTAQHNLQHTSKPPLSHPNDMLKTSTARIPFAENPNPAAASHAPQPALHAGFENTQPNTSSKFKTPGRPAAAPKSAKSSPLYPNGDNIALPDIATDSEEDDESDAEANPTGFRAPSWAASPALRDLLTQQQLVDPESVFGPIAELKMDEVFRINGNGNGKNNAERLRRFRDRGSSAAWVESGDAVTSAEKRTDMQARERVVREGGWRYEHGA